jgi:hypothetical protein
MDYEVLRAFMHQTALCWIMCVSMCEYGMCVCVCMMELVQLAGTDMQSMMDADRNGMATFQEYLFDGEQQVD